MRYVVLMCFLSVNLLGCIPGKTMIPQEMKAARTLFLQKDYEDAAEIFSRIHSRAKKNSSRQKALLGLICSRMLAARNDKQFQDALQLWQTWCRKRTDNPDSENLCIFLTPVLEKWSYPGREEYSDSSETFLKQKKELKKLHGQIKVKNQKIKELNKKLKALEAIYQEIDQKKKGMNFP